MSTIDPAAVSVEDIDDDPRGAAGDVAAESRTIDPAPTSAPSTRTPPPIRQALRSDLDSGRMWAREKAQTLEASIREKPMKAAVYAVGAGLVLGMLLRR